MTEKILKSKMMILLLITGAVYLFLRYISPLVTPLLAAIILVEVSIPVFDKIRKKICLPRTLMMALFLFLVILFLGVLIWFLITKVATHIPDLLNNLQGVDSGITVFIRNCCDGIENQFGIDADRLETVIIERVNIFIENFQASVMPGLFSESISYVKYIVSIGAFLVVTAIAVILLVKDYDRIMSGLRKNEESRWFLEILWQVIHYIGTFLKAQAIIMFSISVLCTVVLSIAGIEGGAAFGIFAGIMDMLPFIGTGIVLIPLAIWQFLNGWYVQAVVCLLLYVGCAILREMMEPKLIGDKVGIYPIAILLAVYAGLKLFGVWGILKGPLGLVVIWQIYNGWKERISGE